MSQFMSQLSFFMKSAGVRPKDRYGFKALLLASQWLGHKITAPALSNTANALVFQTINIRGIDLVDVRRRVNGFVGTGIKMKGG